MNEIIIYQNSSNTPQIEITFEGDTFWLSLNQIAQLFERDKSVISRHIKNILEEGELSEADAFRTVAKNATVQIEGKRSIKREIVYYSLDIIIAVGYRVNSVKGTQFRIWATKRLNEYLIQGYAVNQKRLEQKQQEVEFLKTGLRIVSRALEGAANELEQEVFLQFAKGLTILDDYDHELLDEKGTTLGETIYPKHEDYMQLIQQMYSNFESSVFAKPKDDSFHSSINQIRQRFGNKELYPSLEEKAANLLYFITKNHSFVDGNKRIAAACFLYFLQKNKALQNSKSALIVSNETLALLTLYIANSRSEEAEVVKRLIISVLNRNK